MLHLIYCRLAILKTNPTDYCSNTKHLTGPFAMKIRHVEALGLLPIVVRLHILLFERSYLMTGVNHMDASFMKSTNVRLFRDYWCLWCLFSCLQTPVSKQRHNTTTQTPVSMRRHTSWHKNPSPCDVTRSWRHIDINCNFLWFTAQIVDFWKQALQIT